MSWYVTDDTLREECRMRGKIMTEKKAYVIVELNWEYNDENYYQPEGGGGTPIEAYSTREKAEAACYRKNKEANKSKEEYDNRGEWFEVVEVELGD